MRSASTRSYVFLPCAYRSFSDVKKVWSEPLTTEEKKQWHLETLEQLQVEETLEPVETGLLSVYTIQNNDCCWVKTVVDKSKGPFWPLFGQWFSSRCFAPCPFLHVPQKIITLNNQPSLLYSKPTWGSYEKVKDSLPLDSLGFKAVLYQLILAVHSLHISGFVHQTIDEAAIFLSSSDYVVQLGDLSNCTQRPVMVQDTEIQEWKHDISAVALLLRSKAKDGNEWGDQGAEQVWAHLSGKTDPNPDRAILSALPLPYFDAVRQSRAPWHQFLVSQTPPIFQSDWKSNNTWILHQTWLLHQAKTPDGVSVEMLDYHNSPPLYNLWESLLGSFDKGNLEDVPVEDFCQALALGFQLILSLKNFSKAIDLTLVTCLNCGTQNRPSRMKENPEVLMEVAATTQMEANQWMPVTAFRILALEYRLSRKQSLPEEAQFLFALLAQHPAFHLLDQRFVARLVESWLTKSIKNAVAEASHDFASVDSETKTFLEKTLRTLLADNRATDLASQNETAANGRRAFRTNTAHQDDLGARWPDPDSLATFSASQLQCPPPPDEKQANALVQSLLDSQEDSTKDAKQKCLDLGTQLLSREARREKLFAGKTPEEIEHALLKAPAFTGGQGVFLVYKDEDKEKKYVLKSGESAMEMYSLYKEWFLPRHVPPSVFLLSPLFVSRVSPDPSATTSRVYGILPRACKDLLQRFARRMSTFAYKFTIYQLILAIHNMQMAGVVHRDLKPQNVFVLYEHNEDEFLVQIGDYGIARYYPALSNTPFAWHGTPSFSMVCLKDCDREFFSNWIWRQDHLFIGILLYQHEFSRYPGPLGFRHDPQYAEGDSWTRNVIQQLSYRGWPSFKNGTTRQLWEHLMSVDLETNQERSILSALTLPYFDEVRDRKSPLVKFVLDQTPPILAALTKHVSSFSVWRVHQKWLQEQAKTRGSECQKYVRLVTGADEADWISPRWREFSQSSEYGNFAEDYEKWCELNALAFELIIQSEGKRAITFENVYNLLCSTQTRCTFEQHQTPPPLSFFDWARQEPAITSLPVTAFRLVAIDYRLRGYKNNSSDDLVPPQELQLFMGALVADPLFHALDQRFFAQLMQLSSEKADALALDECLRLYPQYEEQKTAIGTAMSLVRQIMKNN